MTAGVFHRGRSEWTHNLNSSEYGPGGVNAAIKKAVKKMQDLSDLLKSKNVSLSVGVYPWPEQLKEMHMNSGSENLQSRIWREFCEVNCLSYVDTFPSFAKQLSLSDDPMSVYKDYYIEGDVHFNEKGNRLIFQNLQAIFHQKPLK